MPDTASDALPSAVRAILANKGKGRDFISGHGLHRATRDGVAGVEIKVRLTSYRALPLSCIEGMQLKIDGKQVDMTQVAITVDQHSYKLAELPALSNVWWFILEHATVFIPGEFAPGGHDVEGTLVTVEPYITAGRFSFYNSSRKQLTLT